MFKCAMVEVIFYTALAVIGLFFAKIILQLLAFIKVILTYDCGQDEEYPN